MVYTIACGGVEITKGLENGRVWREIIIAFIASIPFFTHGVETTTLTTSTHSGHFFGTHDVPWSSTAMIISAGGSAPLFCYIVDKFGRRFGVFTVSLVQGASLIPLFFLNETNTIILHIFAGISSGGLFTVIPIYIREISSTKTRNFTITLMMVMTTAGYIMKLVMNLEEMMYLMAALVGIQIILIILIVESPSYSIMKGKFEEAKCYISTIKGLSVDSPSVIKELSELKCESERANANGKLSLITLYRNKIWWDSMKMGLVLYTCMVLCGSIIFMDQRKILMQLKMDSDPQNQLVLVSMLVGSTIAVITSIFLDRKYILTIGYVLMALASGVLAVYTQLDLTVTSTRWLPVASLAVLVFGYGFAWGLPIVSMVEIFNCEIRATLIGLITLYSELIKLIHVHTFKYIENNVGIYTTLYIFACVNLYGAVYALFVLPDLKKKSMKQIEKQIKRIPLPA